MAHNGPAETANIDLETVDLTQELYFEGFFISMSWILQAETRSEGRVALLGGLPRFLHHEAQWRCDVLLLYEFCYFQNGFCPVEPCNIEYG